MINAYRTPGDARWYRASLGLLFLGAWAALAIWGASPYAGLLDHAGPSDPELPPSLRVGVFVVGWTLMTIAMMLPASLPLVNLFRAITRQRSDATWLLLLLIGGYLAVWAYFGLLAYLGDEVVHTAIERLLEANEAAHRIGPAVLLLAGIYQFTGLKQMCLDRCRSPRLFLLQHWRGLHQAADALRLGLRHGAFCLGCCWTLMLLMFAVGGVNLGWMLALAAVMAAERATPWGRRLTRPLGAALIVSGALLLVLGLPLSMV